MSKYVLDKDMPEEMRHALSETASLLEVVSDLYPFGTEVVIMVKAKPQIGKHNSFPALVIGDVQLETAIQWLDEVKNCRHVEHVEMTPGHSDESELN